MDSEKERGGRMRRCLLERRSRSRFSFFDGRSCNAEISVRNEGEEKKKKYVLSETAADLRDTATLPQNNEFHKVDDTSSSKEGCLTALTLSINLFSGRVRNSWHTYFTATRCRNSKQREQRMSQQKSKHEKHRCAYTYAYIRSIHLHFRN